ncbi:TPA: hypothetical protein H1005_02350 [archaeon]|nr:hypothetical protein [Candidatus Naiadarchaeales archaeon SRR2090153.bin1042]
MAEKSIHEIESEIIDTFASISQSLGYSEVHGKILAALLLSGKPLCLEVLAKKTRYSISMISLSTDLLEVIGLIKKSKKPNDRRLYLELSGDLVEALKTAIMLKLSKGFADVQANFSRYKEEIMKTKGGKEKEYLLKSLERLEKETKRIEKYVAELSKIEIPR